MESSTVAAIVVPFSLLTIVIIPVLLHHQRKMAELIHSRRTDESEHLKGRVAQLEREMQEMKDRVNTAAIENDRLRWLSREDHLNA